MPSPRLCAATIGVGLTITTLQNALIIYAIGAPIFLTLISLIYLKRFHSTTPFHTAFIVVGFVMAVDFFVVALVLNRSLAMFASLLGTWMPCAVSCTSTYVTGRWTVRAPQRTTASPSGYPQEVRRDFSHTREPLLRSTFVNQAIL